MMRDLIILDDPIPAVPLTAEQRAFLEEFIEFANRRNLIARTPRYDLGGAE